MNDDTNIIDDLMPDPESPQWVAIIKCSECGDEGTMYSTGEPRETTVWDCKACGHADAIHHTIMKANTSQQIER